MLYTTVFTAIINTFTLVNASPIPDANATSALESRALRGGYFYDSTCWLKGHFNPNTKDTYGLYDGAQCPPSTAGMRTVWATTIDLNKCLLNQNGQLKWLPDGNAFGSCRDCSSKPGQVNILRCSCDAGGGRFVETSINLNKGLYQEDNRLKCFGFSGTLTIF